MGLEVPGMGDRGCGYGISVSKDGDSRLWIWEKGRLVWEKLPIWVEVPFYGKSCRFPIMGRQDLV